MTAHLAAPPPVDSLQPVAVAFGPDGFGALSLADCHGTTCRGEIWTSNDLGNHWRHATTGTGEILALQALPGDVLVASTADRVYLMPRGGSLAPAGAPFKDGESPLHAVFADRRYGYVAVQGGCATQACAFELWRTRDGGMTWQRVAWDPVPAPWPTGGANLPLGTLSLVAATGPGGVVIGTASPASGFYVSSDGGRRFAPELMSVRGTHGAVAETGLGWAVSDGACGDVQCGEKLYRTTDGGQTWQAVRSLAPAGGLRVSVAYDGTPWLTTTLRHAGDCDPCAGEVGPLPGVGGAIAPTLPRGAAPLVVDAVTSRTAIVIGWLHGGYVLWRTVNGARSWRQIAAFRPQPFPTAAFGLTRSGSGWALGAGAGRSAVLFTPDGGRRWRQGPPLPGAGPSDLGSAGDSAFWDVAPPELYLSRDDGRNWQQIPLPRGFLVDAGFGDALHGYAILARQKTEPPDLFLTADGGRRWQVRHDDVTAAALGRGGLVYALGQGPGGDRMLFLSRDDGRIWQARRLPSGVFADGMGVAPDGTIWLQGGSAVWYSADGGRQWQTVLFGEGGVSAVSFLSWRRWWVLTPQGLYLTTSGGRTWRAVAARPVLQAAGVP